MDALPTLTTEMAIVLAIVVLAIILFSTELLRVDVVALLVLVTVTGGTLEGTSGTDPKIRIFKGVPFAAPPVQRYVTRAP